MGVITGIVIFYSEQPQNNSSVTQTVKYIDFWDV
jgi:hypothetical protein